MQITLFGYIWLLLIILAFLSKGYKCIVVLTLFSMVIQSNNMIVLNSTVGIGPQIITSSVCLIKLYLAVPHTFTSQKIYFLKLTPAFGMLVSHVLFTTFLNVTDFGLVSIMHILMLVVYYMCFSKLSRLEFDHEFVDKIVFAITSFVFVIGIFQMLVVSGILSGAEELLRVFIFNDTISGSTVFNVKTVRRFYSTFMEPSFAGAFLVGAFNFGLLSEKTNPRNTAFLIVTLVFILLTQSTTAYAALFFSMLVWIASKTNKRKIRIILPIFIVFGMMGIVIFYDVLQAVVFDKLSSGSAVVRGRWNDWAIEAFKENPIAGTGYKTQRASSLTYTILAELGGIGFFFHSWFMILILKPIFSKKTRNKHSRGTLAVMGVFLAQIIAVPDLSFSPFWFWMYVLALSSKVTPKIEDASVQRP